jgi:hypothetical protein
MDTNGDAFWLCWSTFQNGRKEFYRNTEINFSMGDIVATVASQVMILEL